MEDYMKTTGKEYPNKAFKCECGRVFSSKASKKDIVCPECGSKQCSTFKQTTASLPEKE